MLRNREFPEAWSCLCVCQDSFLMTFAMGRVPHTGSRHAGMQIHFLTGTVVQWLSGGTLTELVMTWGEFFREADSYISLYLSVSLDGDAQRDRYIIRLIWLWRLGSVLQLASWRPRRIANGICCIQVQELRTRRTDSISSSLRTGEDWCPSSNIRYTEILPTQKDLRDPSFLFYWHL